MKFLVISQRKILGSSLLLPAYGREGQGQHIFISGAFCEAKNEIRWRRKSPPSPFGFGRASEGGQIFFKIQRPDFRGKKFGFRSAFGANLFLLEL